MFILKIMNLSVIGYEMMNMGEYLKSNYTRRTAFSMCTMDVHIENTVQLRRAYRYIHLTNSNTGNRYIHRSDQLGRAIHTANDFSCWTTNADPTHLHDLEQAIRSVRLVVSVARYPQFCIQFPLVPVGTHNSLHSHHGKNLAASSICPGV